jgi:hypothetical protein
MLIRPLLALLALASFPLAAPAESTRQKGLLAFTDHDGRVVGVPGSGTGPLTVTPVRTAFGRARLPGNGRTGPVINERSQCLTLLAPMDIRWARCEPGALAQHWTRKNGGLEGSPPYKGMLDADARLKGGILHIVRGEPGLHLLTEGFEPAGD